MSFTTALPLRSVRFTRGLLAERAAKVRSTTIPYQWEALNDRIPGAERSGCVSNLKIAAGEQAGEYYGIFFQDSDLAKWMEAASHRLGSDPDPDLERILDQLAGLLARAQQPDGYLNTYYQLVEPANRFTNLRDYHELYCAGHLIEAGVAHFEATGKRNLLDVVRKLADLLVATFGRQPGQIPGYCGHEEVELALVKLARATGDSRYLLLAAYFVDQRGVSPSFFVAEATQRGEKAPPHHADLDGLAYWQAHLPVREQSEPVGHAVRAMYLYSAMADLALERHDDALLQACRRLWASLLRRHLYVTGGMGSDGPGGERFANGFDLPNDRAYAETCASIGLIFFARRMLDLELRAEYGDVMEQALYNNVLAGMGADGQRFFYVNPLESRPADAARRYDCRMVKTARVPWFGCACCPPNIARLLASLAHYAYAADPESLTVHLYAEGEANFAIEGAPIRLRIKTQYPWADEIGLEIDPGSPVEFELRLRIPGWCRQPAVTVNGATLALHREPASGQSLPSAPLPKGISLRNGYLAIDREWRAGDRVMLRLPLLIERLRADSRVAAAAGCVALRRGPLIYCFEETDHGPQLAALSLSAQALLQARAEPGLIGGCVVIDGEGFRTEPGPALYSAELPPTRPTRLRAIPYALWGNRGEGEMRVWIREV